MGSPDPAAALREVRTALQRAANMKCDGHSWNYTPPPCPCGACYSSRALSLLDALEKHVKSCDADALEAAAERIESNAAEVSEDAVTMAGPFVRLLRRMAAEARRE